MLTTIFASAVGFIAGQFGGELISFPFYHGSELGQALVTLSGFFLDPLFSGMGILFLPFVYGIQEAVGILKSEEVNAETGESYVPTDQIDPEALERSLSLSPDAGSIPALPEVPLGLPSLDDVTPVIETLTPFLGV